MILASLALFSILCCCACCFTHSGHIVVQWSPPHNDSVRSERHTLHHCFHSHRHSHSPDPSGPCHRLPSAVDEEHKSNTWVKIQTITYTFHLLFYNCTIKLTFPAVVARPAWRTRAASGYRMAASFIITGTSELTAHTEASRRTHWTQTHSPNTKYRTDVCVFEKSRDLLTVLTQSADESRSADTRAVTPVTAASVLTCRTPFLTSNTPATFYTLWCRNIACVWIIYLDCIMIRDQFDSKYYVPVQSDPQHIS